MTWKPVMIPAWYHLLCLFSLKTAVFLQLTIWPMFLNTVLPIFTFLLVTMLLIFTFYWTQCYPCSLFHAYNISLPSFTFYCFQCYLFFFFFTWPQCYRFPAISIFTFLLDTLTISIFFFYWTQCYLFSLLLVKMSRRYLLSILSL